MKLGCSSWSYHAAFRAGRIDLREWLRVCAGDLELDGVEIVDLHMPSTDPAYLRDLKKTCVDAHLTIAGIGVSNDFGPDASREREVENVRQWCDVAAYLGAPIVRVFAGWVPPAQPEPDPGRIIGTLRKVFGQRGPDHGRIWSDAVYALRRSADYAAERGIVLALQNDAASAGIVGSVNALARAVHDAGTPWLRICLEPAGLPATTGMETLLPATVQAHARMRDVRDDGSDSATHWPELLRTLRLGRYRGFVLLDYEGVEDPETAVPRAARYLRGVLHLLQRQQLLAAASENGDLPAPNSTAAGAVVETPAPP